MRVRLQIPLIIIALAVLLLGASRYSSRPRYSECLAGETFLSDLSGTRSEDKTLLPDLWFGEERLLCDTETGTYYYSLIEGDETAFDPAVRLSGSKKAEVAFSELITEESIKTNHAIPFVVYTEASFCRLQLCCTTLPLIQIDCSTEPEKGRLYSMKLTLFDNREGAFNRSLVSDGTIHVRGNATSDYPKTGYRLSLTTLSPGKNTRNNPLSLLGMRQDDDWILYAAYNDQEKKYQF